MGKAHTTQQSQQTARPGGVDVRAMIDQRFGGREDLRQKLISRGERISIKGIDKWVERNRIPGYWFPILYCIADEEGWPLDLSAYLTATEGESAGIL